MLKKQISLFLIAGVLVNATDFGIYYLLFHLVNFNIAKAISFTCAGIVGYLLNKHLTFEHKHPSYAEVARYAFINFLALAINVLTNQSILHLWPGRIFWALVIATALTGLFAFICFKWWVFRKHIPQL